MSNTKHRGRAANSPQVWVKPENEVPPGTVAVADPHMRGVTSATKNLFDNVYLIDSSSYDVADHVDQLLTSNYERVVINGYSSGFDALVRSLKTRAPRVKIYVVWHGNLLQAGDDAEWRALTAVLDRCRSGLLERIGFVKNGLAEVFGSSRVQTHHILNRHRVIPRRASVALDDGPHLGIWNVLPKNWRKTPFVMLGAASQIKGATVHMTGASKRAVEVAHLLSLKAQLHSKVTATSDMALNLSRMHLNLYATLSECAPMVPLESLAVGTPCLIGPNTTFFRDNTFLASRLVVSAPDDTLDVQRHIELCLAERDAIIEEYRIFAPQYNNLVESQLAAFLEG